MNITITDDMIAAARTPEARTPEARDARRRAGGRLTEGQLCRAAAWGITLADTEE